VARIIANNNRAKGSSACMALEALGDSKDDATANAMAEATGAKAKRANKMD